MTARRAVVIVAVLMASAAAVALYIGQDSSTPGDGAGLAPAFSLPELREGRPPVTLAGAPGTPTVLNFFAAWCEPCNRELPALRDAARAHAGAVTFLGVDHQDSRSDAIERLDEVGVDYPAGYDPKGEVAAKYGVRGMPTTVFIAADGRIVEVHQGELSAEALEASIDRLTVKSEAG